MHSPRPISFLSLSLTHTEIGCRYPGDLCCLSCARYIKVNLHYHSGGNKYWSR
uniref:Uncharacterized protein n=1 Tax=Anguilla anguilla TaxID=7936 RepID=A0A0E9PIW1_ANGAN